MSLKIAQRKSSINNLQTSQFPTFQKLSPISQNTFNLGSYVEWSPNEWIHSITSKMFLLKMLNYNYNNNNNNNNSSNNNSCFPHLNNIFTVVDYRNTFNKNIDKKVPNFCSHVSDLICTIKLQKITTPECKLQAFSLFFYRLQLEYLVQKTFVKLSVEQFIESVRYKLMNYASICAARIFLEDEIQRSGRRWCSTSFSQKNIFLQSTLQDGFNETSNK